MQAWLHSSSVYIISVLTRISVPLHNVEPKFAEAIFGSSIWTHFSGKEGPNDIFRTCKCTSHRYARSIDKNVNETIKPWPNGLTSGRCQCKVSTCVSFGHPLALTYVDFGRSQIRTQVDASFSLFGHPTQVDTS